MNTLTEKLAMEIAEEISGLGYIEGVTKRPTADREVYVLRIARKRYVKNINQDGIETVSHPAQAYWYVSQEQARQAAERIGNPLILKFTMSVELAP